MGKIKTEILFRGGIFIGIKKKTIKNAIFNIGLYSSL